MGGTVGRAEGKAKAAGTEMHCNSRDREKKKKGKKITPSIADLLRSFSGVRARLVPPGIIVSDGSAGELLQSGAKSRIKSRVDAFS